MHLFSGTECRVSLCWIITTKKQILNMRNCAVRRRSVLFPERCWIITKKKQSKLESPPSNEEREEVGRLKVSVLYFRFCFWYLYFFAFFDETNEERKEVGRLKVSVLYFQFCFCYLYFLTKLLMFFYFCF